MNDQFALEKHCFAKLVTIYSFSDGGSEIKLSTLSINVLSVVISCTEHVSNR